MRIATWNIENHRDNRRLDLQRAQIADARADVFVLTEVNAAFDIGPGGVRSAAVQQRDGTTWVGVMGDGLESIHEYEATVSSVAVQSATDIGRAIVVGSVLPWKTAASQAPELRLGDETYLQMFERTLNEHGEIVRRLQLSHSDAIVMWAGDFNQSLSGSNAGASNAARSLLRSKLEDLGLVAWIEPVAHADPRMKAIDLICGPVSASVFSVERIDPIRDGVRMSDHAGYVVELSPSG